jgi:rod shape determining protein RodA
MKIDRRHLLSFDWLWFAAIIALAGVGILAIWSTTEGTSLSSYFGKQIVFLGISLAVFLVLIYFDYHFYSDFIKFIYLAGLGVLVLVLLVGTSHHHNKSWLEFAGISFQPSELVKVIVILALAKYYAESDREYLELSELAVGGMIVCLPMLLVMLQGDLGTAITFFPVFAGLSLLAGVRRRHLMILAVAAVLAVPVGWLTLKDYQKGRIETIFNPANDSHKLGYQTIQSEIAIGSGRFLGKGFKQGSQGQLGFLPARHTDFVFAVWSEERGFVGSMVLLALLLFVTLRLLRTAREARDKSGSMFVAGVLALYLFHIVLNVGMVVGFLPVIGIPLPLVSAGGSSLIAYFASMSICMNIKMRRYVN